MGNSQSTTTTPPAVVSPLLMESGGSANTDEFSTPRSNDDKKHLHQVPGNLMQKHLQRDPMKIFEVVEALGEGSMGSVSRCRKKGTAKGGSARPDYVKKHQGCCFPLFQALGLKIGNDAVFCKNSTNALVSVQSFQSLLDMAGSLHGGGSSSRHGTPYGSRQCSPNNSMHGGGAGAGAGVGRISNSGSVSSLSGNAGAGGRSPSCDSERRARTAAQQQDQFRKASSMISYGSKKEKYYALKSIHLSRCSSEEFKNELKNEVAILKGLDHPNIVKAIETFDFRDRLYLVLELCSGGDLYSRDPYSEKDAAKITNSLLSAVSYLHSKGIVHRDLKFENIMFANKHQASEVKIIDFGLSQKYSGKGRLQGAVGTVYTMAPELLAGDYNNKADVWSLGVILFMLLSSSMPFYGHDRKAIMKHILKGKFHFASKRWLYVSKDAKRFVKLLLKEDPAARPTADDAIQNAWLSKDFDSRGNAPEIDMMDRVQATIETFSGYGKLKKLALMVVAYKSTSEEIGYLRDMFTKFDKLHNGEIDLSEFKATLSEHYNYTEQEMEDMFTGMDIDGTGSVHYCEFLAATIEAHGSIDEERLAEAFDRIDSDDTGYITAGDLKAFLGDDIPEDYIHEIIGEADVRNDNRIDYDEFLNLWNADGDIQLKAAEVVVRSRRWSNQNNNNNNNNNNASSSTKKTLTGCSSTVSSLSGSERDLLSESEHQTKKDAAVRSCLYYNQQKEYSVRKESSLANDENNNIIGVTAGTDDNGVAAAAAADADAAAGIIIGGKKPVLTELEPASERGGLWV